MCSPETYLSTFCWDDQDLEVAHLIRPKLFETFNLVQLGGIRLNGWPDLSKVG